MARSIENCDSVLQHAYEAQTALDRRVGILRFASEVVEQQAMWHNYTDTPDASPAGAWWSNGSVVPARAWMFDRHESILWVTTPTFTTSHRMHRDARLLSSSKKRDILPMLALQISRRRARSQ